MRATPKELLVWGLLAMAGGAVVVAALVGADAPAALVLLVAVAAGAVGQVLVGIAVVAFGVSLGQRHAEMHPRHG